MWGDIDPDHEEEVKNQNEDILIAQNTSNNLIADTSKEMVSLGKEMSENRRLVNKWNTKSTN